MLLGVAVLLAASAHGAVAGCGFTRGGTGSGSLSFGTVIVPRDTPVGTEIAETTVDSNTGAVFLCTSAWMISAPLEKFTTLSTVGNNVYETNIPGIGLRLRFAGGIKSDLPLIAPDYMQSPVSTYWGGKIIAYLTKTASVVTGGGSLETGQLATFRAKTPTGPALDLYYLNLTGINLIVPIACTVSQTAIPVPMGKVFANQFSGSGAGSTSPAVSFSIGLDCDAGTRVNLTLDATPEAGNAPGVIALTPGANAAIGVGVQLQHQGSPVGLNTMFLTGTAGTDGSYSIPLTARYYRTGDRMTGGKADATATFTLTYQ